MFVGIQGWIVPYDSSTIGRIDFSFVILQAPHHRLRSPSRGCLLHFVGVQYRDGLSKHFTSCILTEPIYSTPGKKRRRHRSIVHECEVLETRRNIRNEDRRPQREGKGKKEGMTPTLRDLVVEPLCDSDVRSRWI